MGAPVVERLRFNDFIHYITGIDAYREARKKEADSG